jgi:hypothetical protein
VLVRSAPTPTRLVCDLTRSPQSPTADGPTTTDVGRSGYGQMRSVAVPLDVLIRLIDKRPLRGAIVIPEGAGLCQGESALVFSSFSASVRAAPGEGRRSRRSARSVARTNGLDRGPARRRLGAAGERCVNSVVVRGLQCDVYVVGARPVSRLPVIPSPECSGMEQCAGNTRGQSKPRPRRIFGGQTITRPRACCVRDAHAAGWWVRARMCPSRSP